MSFNKYKIGQRVRVNLGFPGLTFRQIKGTVIDIDPTSSIADRYLIEYNDTDLIPPKDWHFEPELELDEEIPVSLYINTKCECGSASLGYGEGSFHSEWCPSFKKY